MEVLSSFNNIVGFAFLITLSYFAIGQETFTISRNPGSGDPWTEFDRFKLPESKCSTIYCKGYNAYTGTPARECWCQCIPRVATFGFYSGSWTCLANIEVRNQTGMLCKYKFQSEQDIHPLRIVEQGKQYDVIPPSSRCSVDEMTSRYFTCDGRWAGIDSQSFSQWFSIRQKKLQIGSNISTALLGRIIRLNITCRREHTCLLFKLKGTFHCAENVTSIIKSPSSAITSPTTKASVTTPATSPANATANPNDDGKKGKSKASGSSSTVVGVVVTLVIIVVIVIVIVAYVYRKRKRGESVWLVDYISSRVRKSRSTQPKRKTADETQEDPEYAEVTEEQRRNVPVDQAGDIYSYAFDDPQTAYIAPQPAPYNRLVHNQNRADQEGAVYSIANDGPVYNVLERPPTENHIMVTSESTMNEGPPSEDLEPEYHVLEGPDTTMNEGPPSQDLEPEYHVLEGPDTTDETTDSPLNENPDVRASIGTANPSGPPTGHVAIKERRKPPSPPRKR